MPSSPRTLPISCGSTITVVVPRGTTARANSGGGTRLDSICTCASMKPGARTLPDTSIVSSAAYRPNPTMRPSAIATSASCTSPVKTLTTWPPRSSRSAGASPRAILMKWESSMPAIIASTAGAWASDAVPVIAHGLGDSFTVAQRPQCNCGRTETRIRLSAARSIRCIDHILPAQPIQCAREIRLLADLLQKWNLRNIVQPDRARQDRVQPMIARAEEARALVIGHARAAVEYDVEYRTRPLQQAPIRFLAGEIAGIEAGAEREHDNVVQRLAARARVDGLRQRAHARIIRRHASVDVTLIHREVRRGGAGAQRHVHRPVVRVGVRPGEVVEELRFPGAHAAG